MTTTAGTTGVSSEWTKIFTPDNASTATGVDGHLKFKVNQNLPKGTVLQITFPDNITQSFSTGSIKDNCFSMVMYSACEINASSRVQLTLAEDVTSLNFIELYISQGFTMPTNTNVSGTTF